MSKGRVICEDISHGQSVYPIPIVNDVDDENLDPFFQYIQYNVDDRDISDRDMNGCKCVGKCEKKTCECMKKSNISIDKDGRVLGVTDLHTKFYDSVLYECDEATCKCAGKCSNRMTPLKFNLRVELFRTTYAGFGVRSRTFVAEFVGEILNLNEAYHRPNPEDYSYQVVNQHSSDGHYVDPTRYGNISRFFNHSCFENLLPIQFFSAHRDVKRASIGFVAFRDILPGQELTIDYGPTWWERIVKREDFFYCQCDWVYCINPAPGKVQHSAEEAKKLIIKICRENNEKIRDYELSKHVGLVKVPRRPPAES